MKVPENIRIPSLAGVACVFLTIAVGAFAQVAGTKHDLSVTGGGSIKSVTETETCRFCHRAHNANPASPLWGHALSNASYIPYSSATMSNTVTGVVDGATRLCLSCHDGQVAVNALGNRKPAMVGGIEKIEGASNLTTSFLADHPVSFTPSIAGNDQLLNPPANTHLDGQVHLDDAGKLQCTSCHDAHKHDRDLTNQKFLSASNSNAAMCTTCHQKRYWTGAAAHQSSTALFTSAQGQHTGYTTVSTNGCESCHKPHKALQARQLLNGNEEATCVGCHKGSADGGNTRVNITNVSGTSVGPYSKTYRHPTFTTSDKHNPRTLSPRTNNPSEYQSDLDAPNRHAECQDCHNPHAAGTRTSTSGNHYNGANSFPTNGVASSLDLTGVWGVEPPLTVAWTTPAQAGYTRQDPATKEYQICFKCHSAYAYNATPPASPSAANGVTNETDQALEFNPSNASFHGVEAAPAGVQGTYNLPWTSTSTMYCSDCHGDNDVATTWSIPSASGPHGSNNPFILRAPWSSATGITSTSDLCFRCHDIAGYQTAPGNTTKFSAAGGDNLHAKHVSEKGRKCMECHSANVHGWKRPSLIVLQGDGAPYELVGTAQITSWTRTPSAYVKAGCNTGNGGANGQCH